MRNICIDLRHEGNSVTKKGEGKRDCGHLVVSVGKDEAHHEEKSLSIEFPAIITPAEEGGYLVDFPDFDGGVFTEGETLEEALLNAAEVLSLVLEERLEAGKPIPTPGRRIDGPDVHMISPCDKITPLLAKYRTIQKSNP